MKMTKFSSINPIVKTAMTFLFLLIIGASLIYFGSRNDAVSVAKSLKSGVLTADEINIAFEKVGGKLIERHIQESQIVQKGDILMVLNDEDTNLAIERLKADIRSQQAQIRLEAAAIQIATDETHLMEITSWRKIEEMEAMLNAARASENLAKIDFDRMLTLSQSGSASESQRDNASNALTRAKSSVIQAERQLTSMTIGATPAQRQTLSKMKNADGMTLNAIIHAREKIKNRINTLDQLEARLSQLQVELKQLELNRSRLTLVAPETGKILKIFYEPGEIVPVGAPAVLLETYRKYVDIYVNETMVSAYQPNTAVTAHIPALKTNVKGVVRFATVAPSFSDLRTTRERGQADLTSFQVRIYTEEHPQLLTGMTLEVNDEQHR